MSDILKVNIKNRDKVVFEGEATAITSVNDKGTFDVLSQHVNFITLIKDTVIVHKQDNTEVSFPVTNGVLKVFENTVQVYLGIVQHAK